jgi:hypothetical protein
VSLRTFANKPISDQKIPEKRLIFCRNQSHAAGSSALKQNGRLFVTKQQVAWLLRPGNERVVQCVSGASRSTRGSSIPSACSAKITDQLTWRYESGVYVKFTPVGAELFV